MRLGWVFLVLSAACGRVDFAGRPSTRDGAPPDVARDATVAPMIDAPGYCEMLTTVTAQQCATAFANPASATDQVIYDCSLNCQMHECVVRDTSTCGTCACQAYADSWLICDAAGNCNAPLSGTGCLGGGFYGGPPFDCTSANGLQFEGACVIRYLISIGDC